MEHSTLISICGKPIILKESHGSTLLVSGYECSCGCSIFLVEGVSVHMSPYKIFPIERDISCFSCNEIYHIPDPKTYP